MDTENLTKVTILWQDHSEYTIYTDRQKALDFVENPFKEDWVLTSSEDFYTYRCVFASEVEESVGGWLVQGTLIKYKESKSEIKELN